MQTVISTAIATLIVGILTFIVQWALNRRNARQAAQYQAELNRQLESHKNELKVNSDHEIEKLRNKLRLDAFVHETRFKIMHSKQAEVIDTLFNLIWNANQEVATYTSIWTGGGIADKNSNEKVVDAINKVWDYHVHHQIYISKSLASQVQSVMENLDRIRNKFRQNVHLAARGAVNDVESVAFWDKCQLELTNGVGPLLDNLKSEFRRLIGVEDK